MLPVPILYVSGAPVSQGDGACGPLFIVGRRFPHNPPMTAFDVIGFTFLLALTWLWFDSMQARTVAIREAEAACAAEGLQFLDQSIAIQRIGPGRDDEGRLRLRRVYAFDYSVTGTDRGRGSIVMLGQQPLTIRIGTT
jgi:hypothetical protein